MESILDSIKHLLGIDKTYTNFDDDIIIDINSALMMLCQLGIGPVDGYTISNNGKTWNDFFGVAESDAGKFALAKTYAYLKVRLMFDPPTSASVLDSIKQQITEYEWRLSIQAESGGSTA